MTVSVFERGGML